MNKAEKWRYCSSEGEKSFFSHGRKLVLRNGDVQVAGCSHALCTTEDQKVPEKSNL